MEEMSGILKAVLAIIRSVKNYINKAITHILLIIAILLVILLLTVILLYYNYITSDITIYLKLANNAKTLF